MVLFGGSADSVQKNSGIPARHQQRHDDGRVTCLLCAHRCTLFDGERGRCDTRVNRGGTLWAESYGQITALALDPIEKKPLAKYMSGTTILSLGSWGCNLRCPFCQNVDISWYHPATRKMMPEDVVGEAKRLRKRGNIGIAYTYNEALTNYEYVYDCAVLAHEAGLKNVLVSNGMVSEKPLVELLPYLDAANIDLKAFREASYRKVLGGVLSEVKRSIRLCDDAGIHLEVTTLVIPGFNDSDEEMDALSSWLSQLSHPPLLHLTRFFPRHQWSHLPPTSLSTLHRLQKIAQRHLPEVRLGNV